MITEGPTAPGSGLEVGCRRSRPAVVRGPTPRSVLTTGVPVDTGGTGVTVAIRERNQVLVGLTDPKSRGKGSSLTPLS